MAAYRSRMSRMAAMTAASGVGIISNEEDVNLRMDSGSRTDSNGLIHAKQSTTHGTTLGNTFCHFVDDSDLFAWIMINCPS